jgi:glyoxylase-like metal-dependent hydrolase (beta-lactamase superfamily II)
MKQSSTAPSRPTADGKVQRWQVGDVQITKVVEIELPGPATWIIPKATPENLARETWLQPHFCDAKGVAVMSVHALVVESAGCKVLVDTCVGNDKNLKLPNWNKRTGPFLEDLTAAGHPPESIDRVLCTHLHVDHVGWNTRLVEGRWVPTFPNARYLFGKTEFDFWQSHDQADYGEVIAESVQPVFDAGRVDLVASDHVVTDEIRLEPTPGHTPGHVAVRISSQGEEAVITGDLMHHPVQCAHPDWGSSADWKGGLADETRRAFLDRYAGTPTLVIGTHFATPTAGHIVRDGDRYRFAV